MCWVFSKCRRAAVTGFVDEPEPNTQVTTLLATENWWAAVYNAGKAAVAKQAGNIRAAIVQNCPGYFVKAAKNISNKAAWHTIVQICGWIGGWFAWAGVTVQGIVTSYCANTVNTALQSAITPHAANFGTWCCGKIGFGA